MYENIFHSVIANLIVIVLIALVKWLPRKSPSVVRSLFPRLSPGSVIPLLIVWAGLNIGISCYVILEAQSFGLLISVFFISSSAVLFLLWKEINQLRSIGIISADQQVAQGIDYKKSLELCRNHLIFLGIGASKLTNEEEFERALLRCRKDKPTKFLLINPESESLISAAKMFGVERDEYQRRVRKSLKKISQFKSERGLNIEVRFYSGLSPFRLMFIDDSLCLLSYNVLGEGDGRQLPQLHIIKAPQSKRVSSSFYHAFELYFNNLWESSAQYTWDFESHLE